MSSVESVTVVRAPHVAMAEKRRGVSGMMPSPETLEGRRLLSFLQPFGTKFDLVRAGGVADVIAVSGPGQVVSRRIDRKTIAIRLFGTTQDSQVTISTLGAHAKVANPLQIGKIAVRTGRLGSFQGLTTADLDGPITPLTGPVSSLQFDAINTGAQLDINGNLGQLTVNRGIDLGTSGHIRVSNDLTGSLTVAGDVVLGGGQINIGRDLAGAVSIGGDVTIDDAGLLSVGRNLGGPANGVAITGDLSVDTGGKFAVDGNLSTMTVAGNIEVSGGGEVGVAGNLNSLTVNGGGGAPVTGNLTLGSGSELFVGQNLGSLAVGSQIDTSKGGEIQVAGNLGVASITGGVLGKGSEDLVVGADLGQLTVLGSRSGEWGLQGVNIDVTQNIQGLDIRDGISDSLITAGTLIDGGTPGVGSDGWNIGVNGTTSVFDSEIRAGFEIRNVTIGGDVESDLPGNSASGRPARIVAGEDKNGDFSPGGIIDNFQIVGRLIDAVIAASVQPYGGTGAEPPTPIPPGYTPPTSLSDDNGYKTYDEPAGTMTVSSATYATYTAPPYDPSSDPTIDDLVLPGGAINPSFAPALSATSSLPSKSTVLGGVVSTAHGDNGDFAGIFAANTNGVFVGPLPTL